MVYVQAQSKRRSVRFQYERMRRPMFDWQETVTLDWIIDDYALEDLISTGDRQFLSGAKFVIAGSVTKVVVMASATILLVEDEIEFRESLHEMLEETGFGVSDADASDVGLTMLTLARPQMLVTDINIPGRIDGAGLAEAARLLYPDLPILFITGRPESLQRALQLAQPVATLIKPFAFTELLAAFHQLGVQ